MKAAGFSAGTSLYASARRYRSAPAAAPEHGAARTGSLLPAAAIYVDGRFVCYGEVRGDFIDCYPMGGAEPVCRPTCSPCRTIPGQPGRSRFCVRRNCDVDEIPC